MPVKTKSKRGFASISPEQRRAIASKGGKASAGMNLTAEGRRKGGLNSNKNRRK